MTAAPSGYATGWFVVATSAELAPGEVRSLTYFGRRLVAYRGAAPARDGDRDAGGGGAVRVLDAYCPHLGADLGVGGTVVDDTIRCPFHAWRFAGDGSCVEIPYNRGARLPVRACVKAWPVRERNGFVFVWHDRLGRPPSYEIPVIAEHGSPAWTDWTTNKITIRTQPREIVENVADKGHFPAVHGTHIDEFDNEFVDHMAVQRSAGIAYPRGGGSDRFKLTATYYGPAYQVTEMESFLPNRLVNAHTPIDEHTLDLRFGVMLEKVGGDAKMARYAAAYVDNLQRGFAEDVQVWEHKVWRDRPVLCDGDGPIGALRRWYRQFYPEAPAAAGAEEQAR
ncbi:MAG: aromatic ring-hydroxylating dioxygenase subunit alpha [Myxococcales bacterium]|nr:aromatic ring-hydroxylating dioxygenase subunit alpha [Myxococcales bacterium]